jgi:hypothetical protein
MEVTGHYWKNLFAWLTGEGFAIALLNPIRTRRFSEEELQRTKTDHIDALGIARFAARKKLKTTPISNQESQELRPARPFAPAGYPASRRPRAQSSSGNRSDFFRVHAPCARS